jgi:hypothetical protein
MKTNSTPITLRNKLTGLFYKDGTQGFCVNADEATVIEKNSSVYHFVRFIFGADKYDTIEEVEN